MDRQVEEFFDRVEKERQSEAPVKSRLKVVLKADDQTIAIVSDHGVWVQVLKYAVDQREQRRPLPELLAAGD